VQYDFQIKTINKRKQKWRTKFRQNPPESDPEKWNHHLPKNAATA